MSDPQTSADGTTTSMRSPRFIQWVAFLGFSIVTLGSSVEEVSAGSEGRSSINERWAVACSSITFAFTFIMVLMQLHAVSASLVVGTKIEGAIILILTAFWAGTVSVISDARHGLAVNTNGTVSNGNLYYFSWAGFVCAIMLSVAYLRSVFGVDVASELQNRSARLQLWSALLASQLVVMGVSANIFDQDCAPRTEVTEDFCSRTRFGVSVGVIGTVFSLAVVGMKVATSQAPFLMESLLAVFLLLLNGFGVGFLTSARGPGKEIGNLYYFSWISLVCSYMAAASCFQDYQTGKATAQYEGDQEGTPTTNNKTGEIQVEPLDHVGDV